MPKTKTADPSGLVASFERAHEEQCRAEFSDFKGREMFSIRCWYNDAGTLKPGRNGINLPIEERADFLRLVVALFPDDIQLVEKSNA